MGAANGPISVEEFNARFAGGKAKLARGRSRGAKPTGMNKTERAYSMRLQLLVDTKRVEWWGFELVKLKLTDLTFYTPDFFVQLPDGVMEFHEIKGGQGFEDDALVKIKMAAELYPMFVFRSFIRTPNDGWKERVFTKEAPCPNE